MRKSMKKGLALVLSAALALGAPVAVGTQGAKAAETGAEKFEEYTVGASDKSTGFWKEFSKPYKVEDGETLTIDFAITSDMAEVWHSFVMVFTNQTDLKEESRGATYKEYAAIRADRYSIGGAGREVNKSLSGVDITYEEGAQNADPKEVLKNAEVTLEISRSGKDVTIKSYAVSNTDASKYDFTTKFELGDGKDDKGDGTVYFTLTLEKAYVVVKNVKSTGDAAETPGTGSSASSGAASGGAAAGGAASGGATTPTGPAVEPTEAPTATEPPAATEAPATTETPDANTGDKPGTSFDNVSTEPVVKYTFDSATENDLKVSEKASVKDGILNLATEAGHQHEYYAKIKDLSSYDFSKGFTWTADVKVGAWPTGDWTGIITLGDGEFSTTVDGALANGTTGYHFTIGLSSILDYKAGFNGAAAAGKVGYFGNNTVANDMTGTTDGMADLGTVYPYDWYSQADNQNRWDTITVTIDTDNTMTTYINGKAIRSAKNESYKYILESLKNAKNNYVGTGYWPDDDFIGSLDNVGIYNTALSAEDVAKLTTSTSNPGSADTGNQGSTGSTDNNQTSTTTKKKTIKITGVKAKGKKVTGKVSVKKATVKVKVGKAKFKKAKVKGKKFTFTVKKKMKKGTKVVIKATKKNYKTKKKTVKAKKAKK